MRPSFSIIFFTVLSGLGYGAWFLLGLGLAIGPLCSPRQPTVGEVAVAHCHVPFLTPAGLLLAFLLVCIGLLCSLGHLGKPQRAWRALSQWRSSWLSREGVLALLTFIPATLLLAREIFIAIVSMRLPPEGIVVPGWLFNDSLLSHASGFALAAGSLATVYCTANIYASLKPVRAWHEPHVLPGYLLLSLFGGCLLLPAASTLDGMIGAQRRIPLLVGVIMLSIACAWLKHRYWRSIDAQPAVGAGHATGLESLGSVRSFEQPHTEENYLTHEMGFVLARKHARKLRRIVLILGFLVPAVLAVFALAVPAFLMPAIWIALVAGLAGVFVERWLFFAEAKHAVMVYYAR